MHFVFSVPVAKTKDISNLFLNHQQLTADISSTRNYVFGAETKKEKKNRHNIDEWCFFFVLYYPVMFESNFFRFYIDTHGSFIYPSSTFNYCDFPIFLPFFSLFPLCYFYFPSYFETLPTYRSHSSLPIKPLCRITA